MTDKDANYYAENAEEFNSLTDDDKQSVFEGGSIEATDTTSESEQDDTSEQDESTSAEKEEQGEDDPVLMAKDGKNTIPFSELANARSRAADFEELSKQQAKFIEELQDAKALDDEAGTTEKQDEIIAEYEGDYPEIAEELKPLIQEMIDEGVKRGVGEVEKQFNERVAPIQEAANKSAEQHRYDSIVKEHPDAVEIYSSDGLKTWVDSHPSFIKDRYNAILKESTAEQMNELFTAYKLSSNFTQEDTTNSNEPGKTTDEIIKKAQDSIDKVKPKAPGSLTDIPASQAGTLDEAEAMLEMSAAELDRKFDGKSPEQIRDLMAKLV